MRDYKFTLQAGVERSLNVKGNWFHVLKASGEIKISFSEGSFVERLEGQGGSRAYERVAVMSPVDQTVTLSLGFGQEVDNRAKVSVDNLAVNIEPPNSTLILGLTLSGGIAERLLFNDTKNSSYIISVPSDAVCGVYVYTTDVNIKTLGFLLEVGQTLTYSGTVGLWAISETGDPVRISTLRTRYVV